MCEREREKRIPCKEKLKSSYVKARTMYTIVENTYTAPAAGFQVQRYNCVPVDSISAFSYLQNKSYTVLVRSCFHLFRIEKET